MSFPGPVAAVVAALLVLSACSSGNDPGDPGDPAGAAGDVSEVPGVLLDGDSAALSTDGSRLVVPCDGELCVWSTADGSLADQWDGGGVVAWSVAGLVATDRVAGGTVSVVLLDAATGEETAAFDAYRAKDVQDGPDDGLRDLAFSADGETLAGVGADGVVRLWPVGDPSGLVEIDPGGDAPVAVAFSPDNARLAVASSDAPVTVHDTRTGEALSSLDGPPQGDVAWSGDGAWIAGGSATSGGEVGTTVWDADSLAVEATLPDAGHRVGFTPSSDALVITVQGQRDLVIWSWSDDDRVSLAGSSDALRAVLAAPDGSGLYAVSPRDGVLEWGARGVMRTFDRPQEG